MKRTVLALQPLPPDSMRELEARYDVIRLWMERDPELALRNAQNDIVAIVSHLAPVRRKLIEALPNLEIIANCAVGTDNIDLEIAQSRNIAVTNTPDVLTEDVADIALALMLSLARRIVEGDMYVRVGRWTQGPLPFGVSLGGKTVGIVGGAGRIGRAFARRAEALGMKIAYHGRRKHDDLPYPYYGDIGELAAISDFLVLTCSGGKETQNIIDAKILEMLGSRSFLINVSRGSVIKEEDLLIALRNGTIAGAGLDVYADEPRVPEALLKMDNVVLLPHIGSATHETRARMGQMVLQNLEAHFEGRPLLSPVKS